MRNCGRSRCLVSTTLSPINIWRPAAPSQPRSCQGSPSGWVSLTQSPGEIQSPYCLPTQNLLKSPTAILGNLLCSGEIHICYIFFCKYWLYSLTHSIQFQFYLSISSSKHILGWSNVFCSLAVGVLANIHQSRDNTRPNVRMGITIVTINNLIA